MKHDGVSFYEKKPSGDTFSIISVPLELGADERGLAETPEYLRKHGLEHMFTSLGCEVGERTTILCPKPIGQASAGTMKHVQEIATVGKRTRAAVERAIKRGDKGLVIGGDHAVGFGAAAGALARYQRLGVIYIDAHPDANTHETTISGNVHGMVASAMLGHGHEMLTSLFPRFVKPHHFLFAGLKDFDQAEIDYIKEHQIPAYTALDIATHGLAPVAEAIERLSLMVDAVWVSMDMDSIDEHYAPGVAMTSPDGLTRREVLGLAHHIGRRCNVIGMDISEMVPAKDKEGKTASLAIELIARFFGHDYNWYSSYMDTYRQTNIANEPEKEMVRRGQSSLR
ncbi:MAG TPA: arginase family protein [Candidatus Paceibacterota bacterium]